MPKNLIFTETPNPGKLTKIWEINSTHTGAHLGRIGYYPQWRKYVFAPDLLPGIIFDVECSFEIVEFLREHKDDRQ